MFNKRHLKTKLVHNLTFKMANVGPEPNLTTYAGRLLGGTAFLQKTGRFGVHLKAGSGTPHGPRGLFCSNTHLNLCTGQLGAKPLRQGVALIKIGQHPVVHIVQALFACTNLKIFVCKKCLVSPFCKILCSYLLECLFLWFNSVLGCARFSARFLTREQFENICVCVYVKHAFFL